VKSTPVVNFINILRAAFAPIFLRQKNNKAKLWRKAVKNTFARKQRAKNVGEIDPWMHAKRIRSKNEYCFYLVHLPLPSLLVLATAITKFSVKKR